MRHVLSTTAIAVILAACSYNSLPETTPTWSEPTPVQAAAPAPEQIDVYTEKRRTPSMRAGCSTMVEQHDDIIVVRDVHPEEVYCLSIAPLRLTTIDLPAGQTMTSAQTGMMDFVTFASADSGGRTSITLRSKCLPVRKDEAGKIVKPELYEFYDQQQLPFCPRATSDMLVTTSAGPLYFRLQFNNETRTRVMDLRSEPPPRVRETRFPTKTVPAQDLYAFPPEDGAPVAWLPDDAWATGYETVITWHRPMPTLPSIHPGEGGEQLATPPTVINDGRAIAMVYPRRLTNFQLRLGSEVLVLSDRPPEPPQTTLFK